MVDGIRERDLTELYHLTDIENLESILKNGLLARKYLINFSDVADSNIISFRERMGLNDYIPFHFFPNNPFDGIVQQNHKNKNFIYICITKNLAEYNDFIIFPKHPKSLYPLWNHKYSFNEGIKKIDWDTLEIRNYKDNNNRSICLAECLTEKKIPANHFSRIVVKDLETKKQVNTLLEKYIIQLKVDEKSNWFV